MSFEDDVRTTPYLFDMLLTGCQQSDAKPPKYY